MVTFPNITRLYDTFMKEFNEKIVEQLTWLNNPLGQIEELSKHIDGNYLRVPAMHSGDGEYFEVLPDDIMTNYSWFVFQPIQLKSNRIPAKLKCEATWNMYIDLEKIVGQKSARELENVKYQIIQALSNLSLLSAAVRFTSISDKFKDAYNGYNISNVDDRFFMQPFAALSCKITVYLRNNVCGVINNQWTADSTEIDASGTNWTADGAIF